MTKNITSIESRVAKMEIATRTKSNNIEFHVLHNAVESIVDELVTKESFTINHMNDVLDKYTLGKFNNPEFSAVRYEAVEDLKLMGYKFTAYDVSL